MWIRIQIMLLVKVLRNYASNVSVYGPPRLHFEPLKLLDFDFSAVPDPVFHSNADPDSVPQPS
jgi:hypothetical protein